MGLVIKRPMVDDAALLKLLLGSILIEVSGRSSEIRKSISDDFLRPFNPNQLTCINDSLVSIEYGLGDSSSVLSDQLDEEAVYHLFLLL